MNCIAFISIVRELFSFLLNIDKMFNMQNLPQNLLKYFREGLAVALAAFYIPKQKLGLQAIVMIAVSAGLMFLILDTFSPDMGEAARLGAGLGIGARAVGFERFTGDEEY